MKVYKYTVTRKMSLVAVLFSCSAKFLIKVFETVSFGIAQLIHFRLSSEPEHALKLCKIGFENCLGVCLNYWFTPKAASISTTVSSSEPLPQVKK